MAVFPSSVDETSGREDAVHPAGNRTVLSVFVARGIELSDLNRNAGGTGTRRTPSAGRRKR